MGCEQLATKAELEALKAEIGFLKALLGQKIDKKDKNGIIKAAAGGAVTTVAATLLPPLETDVKVARDLANGNAQWIKVKGSSAVAKLPKLEKTVNLQVRKVNGLNNVVRFLRGQVNKLNGAIGSLRGLIRRLDGRLGGALTKIARLSGRIASVAAKVLNVVGAIASIFSIIATLASLAELRQLRLRMNAVENQQRLFAREITNIIAIIGRLREELKRTNDRVTVNKQKALQALYQSANALRVGAQAQRTASRALRTGINAARDAAVAIAIGTAVSAGLSALIPRVTQIGSVARTALQRANEALRRRPINRTIVRNFFNTKVFNNTKVIDKTKTIVKNYRTREVVKENYLTPQDSALLRKIDRTTTSNLAVSSTNSVNITATKTITTRIEKLSTTINDFMKTAWKTTRLDKALNAINTLLLLHNAAMLSRYLFQTLGELTSQFLSVIGIQDETGNPLDINGILGSSIENTAKAVLGEQVYQGVSETWHKASRITSAAANLLWSIRSINDSLQQITEWTAENTGKIGNALKRFRVVGQNAYPWMSEQVNAQSRTRATFNRIREGIETVEDTASSLQGVLGEVQSIQYEFGDWNQRQDSFIEELKTLDPREREDNQPQQQTAIARDADSSNPESFAAVNVNQAEVTNGTAP